MLNLFEHFLFPISWILYFNIEIQKNFSYDTIFLKQMNTTNVIKLHQESISTLFAIVKYEL